MANISSNSIWKDADCYDGFELSRPQLFREETRSLFFEYFRLTPSDNVLDGGCGTGVLTRFIANGLTDGKIKGFDISKNFVEYGNEKIIEENLSAKAQIVLDDGFALSFNDNAFDTVINHNYLSVLSDPKEGLRELIRVCKPGGNISVSTGVSASTGTSQGHFWEGEYPINGMERLKELTDKYNRVYKSVVTATSLKQSREWPPGRFPKLFSICGLENISIKPVGAAFAYNDNYWSDAYRIKKITLDINDEIRIITENGESDEFAESGFSKADCEELTGLLMKKQQYLLDNYRTDDSWEWSAGLSCIVTGRKPYSI
jgi:ubiquinone/menaquinone biosynthesis C-methylase UbiE